MSQSKALMSMWPSSRDVLQWHNIWKWGFKSWFGCASSNGYLFEFDLYLVKKQNVKVNLDESVVMQLSENSQTHFPLFFFDNFFNSPLLINKLFEENIYAIGTVRSNRYICQNLAREWWQENDKKTKIRRWQENDKKMARGDSNFQFSFAANGLTINLSFISNKYWRNGWNVKRDETK